MIFIFYGIFVWFSWFIIGSKWRIKAWGHTPILFWTFLGARVLALQALLVDKVFAEALLVRKGSGCCLFKLPCSAHDLLWRTELIKYLGGLISEDKVPDIQGEDRERLVSADW